MSNLTLRNPMDELLAAWPHSLFGRHFFPWLRPDGALVTEWNPSCDVVEAEDALIIQAELPGVDRKDIEVGVSGSHLVVRGEKREEKDEEKKGRKYSERFFGSFERAIPLPEGVDVSKIDAKLKDGVLEVRVPLPQAKEEKPHKIEIKAA